MKRIIMNGRQKIQAILASLFLVLTIVWLIIPGWDTGKIIGLVADAMMALSMVISFFEEEKRKK